MSDLNSDINRLTLDRTKGEPQQMAEYYLLDQKTAAGTSSPPTGGQLGR
jgi:hypothetical protein